MLSDLHTHIYTCTFTISISCCCAAPIRASGRLREKKSNFAGFSGTNVL